MIKITSKEEANGYSFEIEDETEDFDEMGMELATLIRYAYDTMAESAQKEGAKDPDREAMLFVDSIVNDAINGDITETGGSQKRQRGEILHLVDDYMAKKKKEDKDDE
ncbi:MAG: hypothetical protein ACOX4I_03370 [Anaerovoracaceae bacterium]|jgi:hypothetical protein